MKGTGRDGVDEGDGAGEGDGVGVSGESRCDVESSSVGNYLECSRRSHQTCCCMAPSMPASQLSLEHQKVFGAHADTHTQTHTESPWFFFIVVYFYRSHFPSFFFHSAANRRTT